MDYFRWAVLFVITVLITFFIYTAIMYRLFLLSRQDLDPFDLPGYPIFSYMILKQDMKPATILNLMPREKIEESLKPFQKQFRSVSIHCEEKKNAATAFAEFADDHVYKDLYIYWDRKGLETHYDAELKKNTNVRLEIINKKMLRYYETLGATRYIATGDRAFDAKYSTLTNRPGIIKHFDSEFLKAAVKYDIDSLIIEGKQVKVKTEHRKDIKEIISLLLEFEKTTGKIL